MEFIYILLGIAVLCLVWTVLFQVINKNISTRIIKRGEGYTIQVRGKFKWNDAKPKGFWCITIYKGNGNELLCL